MDIDRVHATILLIYIYLSGKNYKTRLLNDCDDHYCDPFFLYNDNGIL